MLIGLRGRPCADVRSHLCCGDVRYKESHDQPPACPLSTPLSSSRYVLLLLPHVVDLNEQIKYRIAHARCTLTSIFTYTLRSGVYKARYSSSCILTDLSSALLSLENRDRDVAKLPNPQSGFGQRAIRPSHAEVQTCSCPSGS